MEPPTKFELALSCTSREYKRMSKESKERLERYAIRWWVEGNRVVYVIPRNCLGKAAGMED